MHDKMFHVRFYININASVFGDYDTKANWKYLLLHYMVHITNKDLLYVKYMISNWEFARLITTLWFGGEEGAGNKMWVYPKWFMVAPQASEMMLSVGLLF